MPRGKDQRCRSCNRRSSICELKEMLFTEIAGTSVASSGLVGLASLAGNLPGPAAVPRAPDLLEPAAVPRAPDLPGPAAVPRAPDLPEPAAVPRASDLPISHSSPVSHDRPQVPQGAGFLQGSGSLASVAAAVWGGGGGSQVRRPAPENLPYPNSLPRSFGPQAAMPQGNWLRCRTWARLYGKRQWWTGATGNSSSTTPAQWLGQAPAAPPGDSLALLVGGINQLQAAMLKQYDGGDTAPEAVKPGTLALPPPHRFQGWLEVITSAMADLSNSSSSWWAKVKEHATTTYDAWKGWSSSLPQIVSWRKENGRG